MLRISRTLRFYPVARQARELSPQRGFTLVELMVVIGIMAIIMAIALPAYSSWRERTAVMTATDAMAAHFKQARMRALAQSRSVTITFTANSYTVDGGAPILMRSYSPNITLAATWVGGLTFSSSGTANNGNVTVTSTTGGQTHTITVNNVGRAFIQ